MNEGMQAAGNSKWQRLELPLSSLRPHPSTAYDNAHTARSATTRSHPTPVWLRASALPLYALRLLASLRWLQSRFARCSLGSRRVHSPPLPAAGIAAAHPSCAHVQLALCLSRPCVCVSSSLPTVALYLMRGHRLLNFQLQRLIQPHCRLLRSVSRTRKRADKHTHKRNTHIKQQHMSAANDTHSTNMQQQARTRQPLRPLLSQPAATAAAAGFIKPTPLAGKPTAAVHSPACRPRSSPSQLPPSHPRSLPPVPPAGIHSANPTAAAAVPATAAMHTEEAHKCSSQCKIKQVNTAYPDKSSYKGLVHCAQTHSALRHSCHWELNDRCIKRVKQSLRLRRARPQALSTLCGSEVGAALCDSEDDGALQRVANGCCSLRFQ